MIGHFKAKISAWECHGIVKRLKIVELKWILLPVDGSDAQHPAWSKPPQILRLHSRFMKRLKIFRVV